MIKVPVFYIGAENSDTTTDLVASLCCFTADMEYSMYSMEYTSSRFSLSAGFLWQMHCITIELSYQVSLLSYIIKF